MNRILTEKKKVVTNEACPRCGYVPQEPHASACPRCREALPFGAGCSGCGACRRA